MIARFHVWLPWTIYVRSGDTLSPIERRWGDYRVFLFAPMRSQLLPGDLDPELVRSVQEAVQDRLRPAKPQPPSQAVRLDEADAVAADILRIDFVRDSFDRSERGGDPPLAAVAAMANAFLQGIRVLKRATMITPLRPNRMVWVLDYLDDNGGPLQPEPKKVRGFVFSSTEWRTIALTPPVWNALAALPLEFEPSVWQTLLLDAFEALPHVGTAVVLAHTAIEARINSALELLAARASVPHRFWSWVANRGRLSVEEELGALLAILGGRSLSDDRRLWNEFQALKAARNSFVHEGQARIGKGAAAVAVSPARAEALVRTAMEIVTWIEGSLLESERSHEVIPDGTVEVFDVFRLPEPPEDGDSGRG